MNLIFAHACPRLKAKGIIIEGFMKRVSAKRMLEIKSDASNVSYDEGQKLMLAARMDVILVRAKVERLICNPVCIAVSHLIDSFG